MNSLDQTQRVDLVNLNHILLDLCYIWTNPFSQPCSSKFRVIQSAELLFLIGILDDSKRSMAYDKNMSYYSYLLTWYVLFCCEELFFSWY